MTIPVATVELTRLARSRDEVVHIPRTLMDKSGARRATFFSNTLEFVSCKLPFFRLQYSPSGVVLERGVELVGAGGLGRTIRYFRVSRGVWCTLCELTHFSTVAGVSRLVIVRVSIHERGGRGVFPSSLTTVTTSVLRHRNESLMKSGAF